MEQMDIEKLSVLDRNYTSNAEQIQLVEQEIEGLTEFLNSLKHLEKSKEQTMLSPLGRGIFMKAQRSLSDKLFVDVGAGIFVKKSLPETVEVIKEQLTKLSEIYERLKIQESFYASQLKEMIEKVQSSKAQIQ